MSQPPNQPPQGGFGAPQDPNAPQGGAPQGPPPGAPQPPPGPPPGPPTGQPGYGYPQGPPTAADNPYAQQAAPQQGYGYPGQPGQPGPYAQQPQQGYGYPGQPGQPGAPVPGGNAGGPQNKQKLLLIIGAAVAALIVIAGGIYLFSGGEKEPVAKPTTGASPSVAPTADKGDGKGGNGQPDAPGRDAGTDFNSGRQPGDSKVLWNHVNAVDLPKGGGKVMPMWFVGDTVIQTYYKTMTAYGAADGKKRWEVPFPNEVCAAPRQVGTGDKVVVAVKNNNTEKSKCNQLQQVDLKAGKAGWRKEMASAGLFLSPDAESMTIAGDTVAVSHFVGGSAYKVSDGSKVFGNEKTGTCRASAFAAQGTRLLAVDNCGSGSTDSEQLRELDATTGKTKWTWKAGKGWAVKRVFSVEPLVVYMAKDKDKSGNIGFFKPNGTLGAQLAAGEELPEPTCGGLFSRRDLQSCVGVAADANTLYVPSKTERKLGTDRSNEVRAYDVKTGKRKWASKGDGRTLLPIKVEGGNVFAYTEPSYDKPGGLVKIPAAGGNPASVLKNPSSVQSIENGMYSKLIAYEGSRLFIAPDRISGKDDEKPQTLLVFGN